MNDLLDHLADLKELQKLYVTGELCYIDFQEKIAKIEEQFDTFEKEMAHFHGS